MTFIACFLWRNTQDNMAILESLDYHRFSVIKMKELI